MKKFVFSLALIIFGFSSLFALESQIILINSEAYLVDLDVNYDVINIHERIPDYFQDHSSHEEILATYKQSSKHQDIGYNCNKSKSDVFNFVQIAKTRSCSQHIGFQHFISNLGGYNDFKPDYWRRDLGSDGLRYPSIV
tara:strand:+ start:213 stop:629 length:417 start_codon:yes stop_codon:yes gene_type:complete